MAMDNILTSQPRTILPYPGNQMKIFSFSDLFAYLYESIQIAIGDINADHLYWVAKGLLNMFTCFKHRS